MSHRAVIDQEMGESSVSQHQDGQGRASNADQIGTFYSCHINFCFNDFSSTSYVPETSLKCCA